MSTPRNQYNTPLLGVVSIGLIRQEADKFINLETHYFHRDTDESNGLWVWFHRHADEAELDLREKAETLSEVLTHFLERTPLGDQIAITLETSDDSGDGPTSLCAGDVLRIIAPACIDTRIELLTIDSESWGLPVLFVGDQFRILQRYSLPLLRKRRLMDQSSLYSLTSR